MAQLLSALEVALLTQELASEATINLGLHVKMRNHTQRAELIHKLKVAREARFNGGQPGLATQAVSSRRSKFGIRG